MRSRALEPALSERLEQRLRSVPCRPLLLLVHGRAQGEIPAEPLSLAAELQHRRGAPVLLRALTDPQPADLPTLEHPLGLVPLLLLPGEHVRHDLPRLRHELRPSSGLKVLPFLGSWPVWQRALAAELSRQVSDLPSPPSSPALLLHHPIASPLGRRYLRLLAAITGATPQEAGGRHANWCKTLGSAPATPVLRVRSLCRSPRTGGPDLSHPATVPVGLGDQPAQIEAQSCPR